MPLCGFNPKMVQGISIFAEGLFEATVARAKEQGLDLEEAFRVELGDICRFLEALEAKHQELKLRGSDADAARGVVDWMAEKAGGGTGGDEPTTKTKRAVKISRDARAERAVKGSRDAKTERAVKTSRDG